MLDGAGKLCPQSILHYSYGEAGDFQAVPLSYEIVGEEETWSPGFQ